MSKIANFVLKYSGAGKAWDMVDGYKMYGSGFLGALTSLLSLLTQLAPLLAMHDTVGVWQFVMHLGTNPAWLGLLASIAVIGKAHKDDKAAATPAPAQPPANP